MRSRSSEGGGRGPAVVLWAPTAICCRSIVLPPRGDGPVECDGADPEAVGKAAGSREGTKCFP